MAKKLSPKLHNPLRNSCCIFTDVRFSELFDHLRQPRIPSRQLGRSVSRYVLRAQFGEKVIVCLIRA